MLYLMIIIFAIIIALLRGGELENLYHISIQGIYLFAAALLLRGIIFLFEQFDLLFFPEGSPILLIISYLLLIAASIRNMKLPGFKYITLGLIMNAFVILVNGGQMPVVISQRLVRRMDVNAALAQGQNAIHSLKSQETLFAFLGDVIPLPSPFPDSSILSVGDILIFVGLFVLIQKTMMLESNNIIPKEQI